MLKGSEARRERDNNITQRGLRKLKVFPPLKVVMAWQRDTNEKARVTIKKIHMQKERRGEGNASSRDKGKGLSFARTGGGEH